MSFREHQLVIVSQGWSDEGKFGKHLATFQCDGHALHLVFLEGGHEPKVMLAGTIEPVTDAEAIRLYCNSLSRG